MSDEKHCVKCSRKLRSDNTGDTCSYCKKGLRPPTGGEATGEQPTTKRRAASDTLKRFRVVANALGKDPDAILEEAAQEWLSAIEKAVS